MPPNATAMNQMQHQVIGNNNGGMVGPNAPNMMNGIFNVSFNCVQNKLNNFPLNLIDKIDYIKNSFIYSFILLFQLKQSQSKPMQEFPSNMNAGNGPPMMRQDAKFLQQQQQHQMLRAQAMQAQMSNRPPPPEYKGNLIDSSAITL